jgi:hypothetical protein
MGLFDKSGQPFKTAYAFKAMGQMQDTPQRFAVEGTDTFGFAVLAGGSTDGNKVQVLISNYAIPADFKDDGMKLPDAVAKSAPLPDFTRFKFLPKRTDIVYRKNAGYNLTIKNLPWGNGAFTIKRYRLSGTQNLELVDKRQSKGDSLDLQSPLAPEAMELIVLERK